MLKNLMVKQGRLLFRWRSYLPLLLLPFAVNAFSSSGWVTQAFGQGIEDGWDVFCLFVALVGLTIRVMTAGFVPKGTSGRATRAQRAKFLNTTGLYSVVRHPLYLGNFLVFLAFALLLKSALFVAFAVVAYVAYYERIILAEEEFLGEQHGSAFAEWAARTPVILPRLRNWVAPSLPFSWRVTVRREFHTVFLIASVFFLSELSESILLDRQSFEDWIRIEPHWFLLIATAAALYVTVLIVTKTTRWLDVTDR